MTDDIDLIQGLLPMTRKLGEAVQTFCRTPERERRADLLAVMREETRRLRNRFSAANLESLATLTSALERLFTGLSRDLEAVNVSTLKTVCHAMDFLLLAASSESAHDEMMGRPIRMLAVDNDPVCLRTLMMLTANNKVLNLVVCDGPEATLRELKTGDYDLVFSDTMMPGMSGFDLTTELRKLPNHRTTLVVFVTCLSDFETKSRSVLSGGCDLIAKPFTVSEVLVKALTLGLKRRFESAAAVAPADQKRQEMAATGASPGSEIPSPGKGVDPGNASAPVTAMPKGVAAQGVIFVDEHGGIRSVNAAAAALLGYGPGEAVNGSVRVLLPDKLQSEENKALLGRVLAGTVKNQGWIEMTARRKDNSAIRLSVAISQTRVQGKSTIAFLLQAGPSTVGRMGEAAAPMVASNPAPAVGTERGPAIGTNPATAEGTDLAPAIDASLVMEELDSRIERAMTSQAELMQASERWEVCRAVRATVLEELRNQLRGEGGTLESLRRETATLKEFCKARVAELEQKRVLLERQAKAYLRQQNDLECTWATIQAQVDSLTESLAHAADARNAAEQHTRELEERWWILEQDLETSRQQEEPPQTELDPAAASLHGRQQ